MAALNRTVHRLERAATLEKLELAPMAIAQTRALLDSLVCAVLAQAKALRENNERKNTDGR